MSQYCLFFAGASFSLNRFQLPYVSVMGPVLCNTSKIFEAINCKECLTVDKLIIVLSGVSSGSLLGAG